MNINRFVIPAIFSLFFLAGCASQQSSTRFSACNGKTFNQLLESTELKSLFNNIALELCTERCSVDSAPTATKKIHAVDNSDRGGDGDFADTSSAVSTEKSARSSRCLPVSEKNYSVLITDFVDIQSFTPASQGLLMGELMRGSLSSVCSTKITQVEFAKFFNLNEKGLVVLSRRVSEIKKDEYDQTEAIVGTYSYLNNKMVLFARKINVVTGKISKMVTRELDYNCAGSRISYTVK